MSRLHLSTRRSTLSLTGALGVAALALTVTPLAQAAGTSGGAEAHGAGERPPARHVPAAEQRAVKHLDHAKIVREAKPLPMPVAKGLPATAKAPRYGADGPALSVPGVAPTAAADSTTSGSTTSISTTTSTSSGVTGAWWPGGATANPNRQVGKLYFDTDPSAAYKWNHCTATAVNSENKSTVLTAGHCVWDETNRR